jgi:hypothetical protein
VRILSGMCMAATRTHGSPAPTNTTGTWRLKKRRKLRSAFRSRSGQTRARSPCGWRGGVGLIGSPRRPTLRRLKSPMEIAERPTSGPDRAYCQESSRRASIPLRIRAAIAVTAVG